MVGRLSRRVPHSGTRTLNPKSLKVEGVGTSSTRVPVVTQLHGASEPFGDELTWRLV